MLHCWVQYKRLQQQQSAVCVSIPSVPFWTFLASETTAEFNGTQKQQQQQQPQQSQSQS